MQKIENILPLPIVSFLGVLCFIIGLILGVYFSVTYNAWGVVFSLILMVIGILYAIAGLSSVA